MSGDHNQYQKPTGKDSLQVEAAVKPVCPYCKVEMTPVNFEGYYESFSYWACDCETLPDAEKGYGNYCGC